MKRIILILAFVLLATYSLATTYYVDNTITDTNVASSTADCTNYNPATFLCSGGSASAFATIADINSTSTFTGGDRLLFRAGITWRERIILASSGTSTTNQITLGAYGTGTPPTISGSLLAGVWSAATVVSSPTFSNGFESGDPDLSDGDSTGWQFGAKSGGGAIVGNETTTIYSGTYSCKMSWTTTTDTAYTGRGVTATDSAYMQFKMNVGSMTGSAGQTAYLRGLTQSSGGYVHANVGIKYVTASTYSLVAKGRNGGTTLTGTTVLNTGTWYTIEIGWRKSATLGGFEVWINGVPEVSEWDLDTSASQVNQMRLGLGTPVTITAATIYFDNVIYNESYIGVNIANTYAANLVTSTTATPHQAFNNAVRMTMGSNQTALNNGEWVWDNNTVYMRSNAGNPDTLGYLVSVSSLTSNLDFNGKSYITVSGLKFTEANGDAVYFSGTTSNYITIDGNTVLSPYRAGIISKATGTANYVTVKNNTVGWAGGHGILASSSHDWTISNNTVYNFSQIASAIHPQLQFSAGIRAWCNNDNSAYNLIVEKNTVYNGGLQPDGVTRSAAQSFNGVIGIGIWMDTIQQGSGCAIRYNKVYNNESAGIKLEFSSNHSVYYNLVYGTVRDDTYGGDGILSGCFSNTTNQTGNKIYNNTSYGNAYSGLTIIGRSDHGAGGITNTLVKNNISSGNTYYALYADTGGENDGTMGSGNTYSNNLLYGGSSFISWGTGTTYSTLSTWLSNPTASNQVGNLSSDPKFNNANGGDFNLTSTSPAIDAGTNVGLTTDYAGKTVPNPSTSLFDIGAYEFYGNLVYGRDGVGITVYGRNSSGIKVYGRKSLGTTVYGRDSKGITVY